MSDSVSPGSADFLVVGGGIAGASVAYELARCGYSVTLLEAEAHWGSHASGRSAAVYMESYGNAAVRALSSASREALTTPDPAFVDGSLTNARGALFIADREHADALERFRQERTLLQPHLKVADGSEAERLVPILKPGHISGCVFDEDALDVDVDRLLQAYLKGLKRNGGKLLTEASLVSAERDGEGWRVQTSKGAISCGAIVNAAGAWADKVAAACGVAGIGLQPKRRTAFIIDAPEGLLIERWPLVLDVQEEFYFKPDAGALLISPANEDDSDACDAQPEELDIAIGAHRVEQVTTLQIRRIKSSWAGLRSFVADRSPVVGADPLQEGFFWLAAQGGYGVQMGPAIARCAAASASGGAWPADVGALGVSPATLSPSRLTRTL